MEPPKQPRAPLFASNDPIIEELIADPEWRVLEDGTVETTRPRRDDPMASREWHRADEGRYRGSGSPYRNVRYRGVKLAAHRVVYRALVGPLDPHLVINHKDGDGTNNHPSNLELVTQGENNLHRFRVLGHAPVIGNHRLTPAGAQMIRDDIASGLPGNLIAAKFRISEATVSEIKHGHIWKVAT